MPGRPHVAPLGDRGGDADGMVDAAGGDLLVSDQAGQDRESGGIRGGPPRGAQGVRAQVPGRAGPRGPGPVGLTSRVEGLVEATRRLVDDDHVVVRAVLDRRIGGDRVGTRVALVVVVERHGDLRLAGADQGERDADRSAVPGARPEVGLEALGRPDGRSPVVRPRVDAQRPDVGVPEAVGGEQRAGTERRARRTHRSGDRRRRSGRRGSAGDAGGEQPDQGHPGDDGAEDGRDHANASGAGGGTSAGHGAPSASTGVALERAAGAGPGGSRAIGRGRVVVGVVVAGAVVDGVGCGV